MSCKENIPRRVVVRRIIIVAIYFGVIMLLNPRLAGNNVDAKAVRRNGCYVYKS